MGVEGRGSADARASSTGGDACPTILRRGVSRRWMLAGYGLFAALLFVAFVTASFPYGDTISAIVAPMRLKIVFQAQRMSFPIGARLEDVRLLSTATQPEELLFQSSDVTVAPGLPSLLLGRPCLRIRAHIFGGVAHATVRQRAQAASVDFELESISLAQVSRGQAHLAEALSEAEGDPPHQLGAVLSGDLSGSGSAQLKGPDIMADSGRIILNGRNVTVAIVNGFPPIQLGAVSGDVSLNEGMVTLRDIRAHGSDGDLEASGEIWLAPALADSSLELTVSLAPTANGRAHFGLLLNMLPHSPSKGPYHIEGLLTSPSVS